MKYIFVCECLNDVFKSLCSSKSFSLFQFILGVTVHKTIRVTLEIKWNNSKKI